MTKHGDLAVLSKVPSRQEHVVVLEPTRMQEVRIFNVFSRTTVFEKRKPNILSIEATAFVHENDLPKKKF